MTTMIIQLTSAAVGSLAFSALFGVRGSKLIWGALGGLLSWSVYLLCGHSYPNDLISYMISAFIISIYAETLSRVKKTPSTVFLVSSLIPLIPGGSLFFTMQHAMNGRFDEFAQRGIYTLSVAGIIALGILFASCITKPFVFLLKLNKKTNSKAERK